MVILNDYDGCLSLSYDNVSEHFDILCVVLLVVGSIVEADDSMPHIETTHIDACEESETSDSVFLCQAHTVSPSSKNGCNSWECNESCEESSESRLGLPDAELIMVVVQIWLLLYLLCFLFT